MDAGALGIGIGPDSGGGLDDEEKAMMGDDAPGASSKKSSAEANLGMSEFEEKKNQCETES